MGRLLELLSSAIRNLRRHKLRSFLTALGIIFGIASVISMISVGAGARGAILAQIQELGTRNVILSAQKPPEEEKPKQGSWMLSYGLTFHDARQIERTLPIVASALPVHDAKRWLWFKSRRLEAKVRGVTPEYFGALSLKPILGRAFTPWEDRERARVCVVRAELLRQAKYLGDPLKLDLKVGRDLYRVVGVLPDREFKSPTMAVLGLDDRLLEVYVPFHTIISREGVVSAVSRQGSFEASRVELDQIVCAVASEDQVLPAARALRTMLEKLHQKRDYQMTVPLELLEQRNRTQRVFNVVMIAIAGISLLVGGIGIVNIMLATITERTKEIGIRRALGASQIDITIQFLIETVTLTLVGGLFGVLLGTGGSFLLNQFTEWHAVVTPEAVLVSLVISCLTGILFGIYPARRAAQMDPITALRHE
ncbi:MAG: ABC transporter permease [Planctomycetota bacterium]